VAREMVLGVAVESWPALEASQYNGRMRFNIRDLLWLTVVVALWLGWWTQRREALRQRLDDRAKISAQASALATREAEIAVLQDKLNTVKAEERAVRDQLAEFVATQDDKARIDVAPGLFYRVATPR